MSCAIGSPHQESASFPEVAAQQQAAGFGPLASLSNRHSSRCQQEDQLVYALLTLLARLKAGKSRRAVPQPLDVRKLFLHPARLSQRTSDANIVAQVFVKALAVSCVQCFIE